MNKTFKKIFLFCFVLLSHIIILFILLDKIHSDKTFSKNESHKSVIRLTKIFVKAEKETTTDNTALESIKEIGDHPASKVFTSQTDKRDTGVNDEKSLYITSVKHKIEKAKSYPFVAKRLKLEGVAEVHFEIKANGKIKNLVVINKSGDRIFIKHTQTLFESIGSFDPLPEGLSGEKFKLSLDIVYKI